MYLRRTRRKNKDGSIVTYIQLCQNYWDPDAACSKTKVIYSFGREEDLDRQVLIRLMNSIKRYLYPDDESLDMD